MSRHGFTPCESPSRAVIYDFLLHRQLIARYRRVSSCHHVLRGNQVSIFRSQHVQQWVLTSSPQRHLTHFSVWLSLSSRQKDLHSSSPFALSPAQDLTLRYLKTLSKVFLFLASWEAVWEHREGCLCLGLIVEFMRCYVTICCGFLCATSRRLTETAWIGPLVALAVSLSPSLSLPRLRP